MTVCLGSNNNNSTLCWSGGQTNIAKMNDNRWFQYDNDDNVCEKIFFWFAFC